MLDLQFQADHVKDIISNIERHKTWLAQLPTGGGKTVEFNLIIKQFLYGFTEMQRGPVLILVHREELLKQTAKASKEILGFDPCLITSKTSTFRIARVYIGMVESTIPRLHMINHPSLIIIDECHIQNFNKIHKQFPDTKILGFTATPVAQNKREPMKNYYMGISCGPSIKDLINLGRLSQNLTRAPKNSVDTSSFTYDKLIGDYNQLQVGNTFRMSSNVSNCIDKYWEFCLNKKTLIFNVNIEHSKEVNSAFVACGIPSRHLDASSSTRPSSDPRFKTEREEIFAWFKETPNAVMNSVMIPTMGFDEPTVQSIILNFSTLSLPKFIQCCGRGSRIVDDYFIEKFQHEYPYPLQTKYHFDIIDLGSNWKNFGDWNEERNWYSIFMYPDSPGEGVAPVKSCPSCEALIHAALRTCPHCGHEFERKKVKEQDIEEMILITKGVNVDAVVERSEKKYKYYGFFELAVDIVNNLFILHGHNPSQEWVDDAFQNYYRLCVSWYDKSIGLKNAEGIEDISCSAFHIRKAVNNFNSLILKRNKYANTIKKNISYQFIYTNQLYIQDFESEFSK